MKKFIKFLMKHTFQITFLLLGLFLLSHIIGLVVVDSFLGEELPLNLERPDMDAKGSFLTIVFAIVFVTVISGNVCQAQELDSETQEKIRKS